MLMWGRGVTRWLRCGLSVSGPFVCRCLTNPIVLRFHIHEPISLEKRRGNHVTITRWRTTFGPAILARPGPFHELTSSRLGNDANPNPAIGTTHTGTLRSDVIEFVTNRSVLRRLAVGISTIKRALFQPLSSSGPLNQRATSQPKHPATRHSLQIGDRSTINMHRSEALACSHHPP